MPHSSNLPTPVEAWRNMSPAQRQAAIERSRNRAHFSRPQKYGIRRITYRTYLQERLGLRYAPAITFYRRIFRRKH